MIFKCINIYNTPFKVIKCKNKIAKYKLKGLKNNTLGKRYNTSRLCIRKKTFKKPFNKNLSDIFSNTLLVNSDNNYNKNKLEIIDPQLLIKDIAVSLATFNIGDSNNDYIYKLIKFKLLNKFHYILSYRY